ncbi:hypothetical protein L1987_78438 [Smallanthus sonchifolius]|uniref:Uncharacterized protein n=1 Tax=Smallanthus sonchifolius TaxID=185202 RepID=A0ACB8ZDQ4_9ASTR|nr:hypothetical protein L1987_78438 [Smallanthus sonchifolius]
MKMASALKAEKNGKMLKKSSSMALTFPDPDFHDIDTDRSEEVFKPKQIWAIYDEEDGILTYSSESGLMGYPDRPGDPDCVYYLRTGMCGYGHNCRFNHPTYNGQDNQLPERVGEPDCVVSFFLFTIHVYCCN